MGSTAGWPPAPLTEPTSAVGAWDCERTLNALKPHKPRCMQGTVSTELCKQFQLPLFLACLSSISLAAAVVQPFTDMSLTAPVENLVQCPPSKTAGVSGQLCCCPGSLGGTARVGSPRSMALRSWWMGSQWKHAPVQMVQAILGACFSAARAGWPGELSVPDACPCAVKAVSRGSMPSCIYSRQPWRHALLQLEPSVQEACPCASRAVSPGGMPA